MLMEPKIGERVKATQNNADWYIGTLVEESEVFAQYGVLLDDTREVRFFIHVEHLEKEKNG